MICKLGSNELMSSTLSQENCPVLLNYCHDNKSIEIQLDYFVILLFDQTNKRE